MPTPATTHRAYPKPHSDNTLNVDVNRIAEALQMIDTDITDVENQQQTEIQQVQNKLHRIRLNTLLNENLFAV